MVTEVRALLLAAMLLPGGCLAVELGAVQLNTTAGSYLHVQKELAPGSKVSFQYPAANGSMRCCIVEPSKSFVLAEPDDNASDAITGDRLVRYKLLRKNKKAGQLPAIGIAVIGPADTSIRQSGGGALDIEGAKGTALRALSCTSAEGVHVTGRRGSELVSDLYIGLGYELEKSTCRDEDLK